MYAKHNSPYLRVVYTYKPLTDHGVFPLWFYSTKGIYMFYSLEISNKGYLDCFRLLLMAFSSAIDS